MNPTPEQTFPPQINYTCAQERLGSQYGGWASGSLPG